MDLEHISLSLIFYSALILTFIILVLVMNSVTFEWVIFGLALTGLIVGAAGYGYLRLNPSAIAANTVASALTTS